MDVENQWIIVPLYIISVHETSYKHRPVYLALCLGK